MKSDEYRSWQCLSGSERIRAVMDLNLDLYAMKGQAADAPRLQRTLICLQRNPTREIEEQQRPAFPAASARDELEQIRKEGREEWLRQREQKGSSPTLEERRAAKTG